MMTRPCVLALLAVALLCGFVAGQEQPTSAAAAPTTPKKPDASADPSPEPSSDTDPEAESEPEPEAEHEAEAEPEAEPEADDTKAKSEASSSENGAALASVSLPSLVLAAVLAKVFAH